MKPGIANATDEELETLLNLVDAKWILSDDLEMLLHWVDGKQDWATSLVISFVRGMRDNSSILDGTDKLAGKLMT